MSLVVDQNPNKLFHCADCGIAKLMTLEFFNKRQRKTKSRGQFFDLKTQCVECANSYAVKSSSILRDEVLRAYSDPKVPRCACCGEEILGLLCVDHIEGGGTKHISKVGSLYRWLKKNDWPKGYQVLCYNCNGSKGSGDLCVHKRESKFAFLFMELPKKERMFTALENALEKLCSSCGFTYPATTEYFPRRKEGLYGLRQECKDCYSTTRHQYVKKVRFRVLVGYSGEYPKCSCCGESGLEFLCIDHVSGNGRRTTRADKKYNTVLFYLSLIKDEFPSGYQVLCWNCNTSKGNQRECIHKSLAE